MQWTQVGQRRDAVRLVNSVEDITDRDDGEIFNEFEQTLRRSTWEQASRALQKVSHVECFRVVFAELVFGLIQRPSSNNDLGEDADRGPTMADQNTRLKFSALFRVRSIIDREGPPVFMERGTRKMHALKSQFEGRQTGFQNPVHRFCIGIDAHVPQELDKEEIRKIGLLYWSAVMFDTVSSSMNGRPVVVSDEHCEHEAAQGAVQEQFRRSFFNRKWNLNLYAQEDTKKALPLRWPCPYEPATRAVARSATVKMLLFRYISYLQTALRHSENSQSVEEIIQHTLSVYRYWAKTHGVLFRDLTAHYDSVLARIKSWFPCIAIPWHLGSLTLADLIELVDSNGLGCNDHGINRQNNCLAMKTRKTSSVDLADLAAVLTPRPLGETGSSQLPGFHFAVTGSPLLTEPWTELLIRAFTKASIFHLDETEKLLSYQPFVFGQERRALHVDVLRLEKCVMALRFLGNKWSRAKDISAVLSKSLEEYKKEAASLSSHGQGF